VLGRYAPGTDRATGSRESPWTFATYMKLYYQSLPSLQNIPKENRWKRYREAYKTLRAESEDFRKKVRGYNMQIIFLVLLCILSGFFTLIFQPSEKMIVMSIVLPLIFTLLVIFKAIEMQVVQNEYIDRFLSKQK
jgi:hypothetical protein